MEGKRSLDMGVLMRGKKTYLIGGLALTSTALLWWYSAIDTASAATLLFIGLGLISLRHGLTTERIKLLLELVGPYRPAPPAAQSRASTEENEVRG